jgi:hypothetical protein
VQLYFLLGGLAEKLVYLSYGLAILLAFIGPKLVLHALHENELSSVHGGLGRQSRPSMMRKSRSKPGEFGQGFLVGRTLVCGDGLLEAVELDQDHALGDSGFVCDDPAADAGEQPPACGLDGQIGQFVVDIKPLRVCDRRVNADPVGLGHGSSCVRN